ncbi:MAG TPA: hypothetical protein VG755_30000, partial [Nannocystaceae bacterium]|nr:hypothetical protein [Nannocystaceae bacterium]
MKALPRIPLFALALAAPFACASDDDDASHDLDVRDAQLSWQATGEVLAVAHAQLDARDDDQAGVVCPDGGTVSVSRSTAGVGDFELTATFDACIVDDLLIDGELAVHTAVAIDEEGTGNDGSIAILIEYDGELDFDGDISGGCTVAAQLHGGAVRIDGHA